VSPTRSVAPATYTFRVRILGGLYAPLHGGQIWRELELTGDQTLGDLGEAIPLAFGFDDPHLWSFFLSGKPWDSATEHARSPSPDLAVQVEPDRAPAVQRDLDELARPAADKPRGDRELIGATTTHTGLPVRAELDRGRYPLGVKVPDHELATVPLARHELHGEWSYTIRPAA
jgi:DDE family transposase/pRiA4b ORF-3-like protein